MVTRGRGTRGRLRGDVPEGSQSVGRGETASPLGSPLVATPSASASPTDANNSRDFTSPSPELPSASTGHIPDSVESTVPHARVDKRKVITVEENGRQIKIKRFLGEMYTTKPTRRKTVNLYLSAPSILLVLVCYIYCFCVAVAAQENLDIALLDKYGEESSFYPEVDTNLWLDVAPHSKKRRIHGLGQGLQLSSGSPKSTSLACSACSTTSSTTAPIIPQSQIDEAVRRAMATMWSTQMAPTLQSFMSQVNQAPTRSSQGEERRSNPTNDDADLAS
ncbi:putative transposase, Ptta/En/Spm, plant [Senna tora]|uniref:Putative transposase, Ptta/En/Spm, plant n=1 Tax=Senna tora TaxID=362788 RepID=A0A834TTY4_9FABA|nr:putative transposase, Ptta/En/Spm, plant [Senna tora]